MLDQQHSRSGTIIYRHTLIVRVTHWVNVLCLTILLMSGLQIFNAHPALYFGEQSNFDAPFLLLGQEQTDQGWRGFVDFLGRKFDTTGFLGASPVDGQMTPRGFPAWATIPSYQDLATGRVWHFFFAWIFVANGLIYLVYIIVSRHLRRDLLPTAAGLSHIGADLKAHLMFRFPRGEEARSYNVIQRLTYLAVIFVILPVLVLAGWTMSPGLDALLQPLLSFFGGRQSARSIHFIMAFAIVLFVLIHIFMVIVSGLFNNLRSMITGRYDIGRARPSEAAAEHTSVEAKGKVHAR